VNWLGLIEKIVRPLMVALGLWKVKQAGRAEAEAEQQEAKGEALKKRIEAERAANRATDDELARQLRGELRDGD